jgi:hypothetical protein
VTITALGPRRGDNTPMAKLAFVKKAEVKGLKNVRVAAPKAEKVVKAEKVTKPAAKAAPKRSTKKAEKAA